MSYSAVVHGLYLPIGESDPYLVEVRNTKKPRRRKRDELCKFYFNNGNCKYGDDCEFSHGMYLLYSNPVVLPV